MIVLQALISVIAQYYLGLLWGGVGVVCGLILSFLATTVFILPNACRKTLEIK
jgi:uncharacterized membrane protein YbaN (DUF454 family)